MVRRRWVPDVLSWITCVRSLIASVRQGWVACGELFF